MITQISMNYFDRTNIPPFVGVDDVNERPWILCNSRGIFNELFLSEGNQNGFQFFVVWVDQIITVHVPCWNAFFVLQRDVRKHWFQFGVSRKLRPRKHRPQNLSTHLMKTVAACAYFPYSFWLQACRLCFLRPFHVYLYLLLDWQREQATVKLLI